MLFVLTLVALLGSGLMAGLFFAFSVSVMGALARRPAAEGIAAMQAINEVILNPVFYAAFFAASAASAVLVALSLGGLGEPGAGWRLAGAALYLLGGLAVTAAFNVPRNNRLAAADAGSAEGAQAWRRYVVEWTAWNHVRTVGCLAALALLSVGL